MNATAVIPAYQPGPKLVEIVRAVLANGRLEHVVVVDDGSGPECAGIFSELEHTPKVSVLRHAVNLGKGAALRTGFNYVLCHFADVQAVVTADADGQHHPEDIDRIAAAAAHNPEALVLGARQFAGGVPLRSRLGNTITRSIVRALIGETLADTQTGLRGVPVSLIPHLLRIGASGYEFELDMLISAKHHGYAIVQIPIRTIYEHGNRSSHFNPLLDSLRIYMVLFRFTVLSMLTAVVDNVVFYGVFSLTANIPAAQAMGRSASILFNYNAARRAVFLSDARHRTVLPKYLLLVAANGFVSYAMIRFLTAGFGFAVLEAKLIAEGILFVANFAIQRDLIFTRRNASANLAARLGQRYAEHVVARAIVEFGCGSESALLDPQGRSPVEDLVRALAPGAYGILAFRTGLLVPVEVKRWLGARVRIVFERKLWYLFPSRHMIVIQKHE